MWTDNSRNAKIKGGPTSAGWIFTARGAANPGRRCKASLVYLHVVGLRHMMESMKRIVTGQGLEQK